MKSNTVAWGVFKGVVFLLIVSAIAQFDLITAVVDAVQEGNQ